MYSPVQIFKQEPAAIVAVLTLLNSLLIAFNVYSMTDLQMSLTHSFALGLLTLVYIRPITVSKDALNQLNNAITPTVSESVMQQPETVQPSPDVP